MRLRIAIATATLGALALIGMTGCDDATTNMLSPEASGLSAMGFSTNDLTLANGQDGSVTPVSDPSPGPSTGPQAGNGQRPRWSRLAVRRALARNVEHGEIVINTKDGAKTLDVQRGSVTAITSTTITVKSADGFSLTWTFGSPIHVIEHRTSVRPSNIAAGTTVGVAGIKNGDTTTANLIVVPNS